MYLTDFYTYLHVSQMFRTVHGNLFYNRWLNPSSSETSKHRHQLSTQPTATEVYLVYWPKNESIITATTETVIAPTTKTKSMTKTITPRSCKYF